MKSSTFILVLALIAWVGATTVAALSMREGAIVEEHQPPAFRVVGEPRPLTHHVKFFEKGDRPLEIVTSRQWFIKSMEFRETLLKRAAELKWHPPYMQARLENWINGLNGDWCVSRQRFFGVVEDEPVGGEAGHREHAEDLVGRGVDGKAVAVLGHPVVRAQDHRDSGGVDEGAALEADENASALLDSLGHDFVELAGDGEVQLPFDLNVPAAGPQVSLGDFKALHHERS